MKKQRRTGKFDGPGRNRTPRGKLANVQIGAQCLVGVTRVGGSLDIFCQLLLLLNSVSKRFAVSFFLMRSVTGDACRPRQASGRHSRLKRALCLLAKKVFLVEARVNMVATFETASLLLVTPQKGREVCFFKSAR